MTAAQDRTLTARLLQALKDNGARAVFGIPGDYALPMFAEIERAKTLPLVTLSHEPSLGFAADAAARIARGIGVVAVTYGAGALNLVNPVAAAYAERSPLAVISAAPPLRGPSFALSRHHQVKGLQSQRTIFREVTCAQAVLDDPASAPARIAETLSECVRRSLPVYFEIPADVAAAPCAAVERSAPRRSDSEAVAECAAEIAALVARAKRPVAMIGVEVRRFNLEADIVALGQRAGIPMVTSFMGRGVGAAPNSGPLPNYLGLAGDPAVTERVETADLLLLFGVILCDTNLGLPAAKLDLAHVVHAFDGEVRVGHHIYRDIALSDLTRALFAHAPVAPRKAIAAEPAPPVAEKVDGGPLAPSDVARAIEALFARHGAMPLACDVGDSLFVSLEIGAKDLLAQAYYASMGFAVPAAIGIQAATGQRPLVLVGDGAFAMTGWEIGNCRRYGFDPIVVVLNNCDWGMLRAFAPEAGFNALGDWHFGEIAGVLGGTGTRVESRRELSEALEAAWSAKGRMQLIEVMLARGDVSDTLRRFTRALGKP